MVPKICNHNIRNKHALTKNFPVYQVYKMIQGQSSMLPLHHHLRYIRILYTLKILRVKIFVES